MSWLLILIVFVGVAVAVNLILAQRARVPAAAG